MHSPHAREILWHRTHSSVAASGSDRAMVAWSGNLLLRPLTTGSQVRHDAATASLLLEAAAHVRLGSSMYGRNAPNYITQHCGRTLYSHYSALTQGERVR